MEQMGMFVAGGPRTTTTSKYTAIFQKGNTPARIKFAEMRHGELERNCPSKNQNARPGSNLPTDTDITVVGMAPIHLYQELVLGGKSRFSPPTSALTCETGPQTNKAGDPVRIIHISSDS